MLSWRSLQGGWLQRVVTQRMATTGSLQTVLTGTDWGLAAVVAGKTWIGEAQAKGAAQNRRAAHSLRKQIGALLLLALVSVMVFADCAAAASALVVCCCWCHGVAAAVLVTVGVAAAAFARVVGSCYCCNCAVNLFLPFLQQFRENVELVLLLA